MLGMTMKLEGVGEAKKLVSPKLNMAALSKAVFNTAHDARKAVIEEMKEVFDRPTPWILRSVKVRSPGTWSYNQKETEAIIEIEQFGGKGQSPAEVLTPHAEGGQRRMKPSEERYFRKYWVPGQGVALNQYGNVPGSLITKILSQLGKFPEVGYMANITTTSRKRKKGRIRNFFVVGPGNKGLRAGVWERLSGGRVRPILIFVDKIPTYYKRFKFYDIVKKTIERNMQRRYNEALNEKTAGLLGR